MIRYTDGRPFMGNADQSVPLPDNVLAQEPDYNAARALVHRVEREYPMFRDCPRSELRAYADACKLLALEPKRGARP